ncbi:hypothetical protein ACQ86N_39040 [Puia sp. P3]|uniref:hypothetical protein n=1 Tax=Puia sp. P3 TaxID=3423952 RepID=UPI003D664460
MKKSNIIIASSALVLAFAAAFTTRGAKHLKAFTKVGACHFIQIVTATAVKVGTPKTIKFNNVTAFTGKTTAGVPTCGTRKLWTIAD